MSQKTEKLTEYLSYAIGGALISQLAIQRSIPLDELLTPRDPRVQGLANELSDLGISPTFLATQTMTALFALFVEEQNATTLINTFTNLLWTVLGDPENGGAPPEIYRRAGVAMHITLLGIINPQYADQALHD